MTRTILYDATQAIDDPKRAEPADRMLAAGLAAESTTCVRMIRFDARGSVRVPPAQAQGWLAQARKHEARDAAFKTARAWILGADVSPVPAARTARPRRGLWRGAAAEAPQGAVFLKVGLRGWADPFLGAWLDSRPDLVVVAVLRAPWELDFPEYASAPEAKASTRAWAAVSRRADVFVALNEAMQARAPAAPLMRSPSELAGSTPTGLDPALAATPFFLQVGPIEARANTLLLLQIWREFAHTSGPIPKLVLAGARGAQTDAIAPMLDWAEAIRPHVHEAGRLNADGLRRLLAHARALLAPDFAAPASALLRDACALGTKVIAADIPIFREIRAPGAEWLDPLAGPAWSAAVRRAANEQPRRAPDAAVLPDWAGWSRGLLAFLEAL